ncbi:hypothetical protein EVAR_54774_1 [Eumeta japonica]|uniref:Uncharacterized protein n=1 Tax=Eumeta variegata TaxID=151549 RepID=A0A4C1YE14_EUMVA|nr:hypothetical protein EVAR_54774_1 [Eumeta japonica]
MDSKRVTRARKMNTAEQENETSMSAPTSRSSETGTSSTWDHGTNENLSGSSPGQERIDEEVCDLHADTRSDRVDARMKPAHLMQHWPSSGKYAKPKSLHIS